MWVRKKVLRLAVATAAGLALSGGIAGAAALPSTMLLSGQQRSEVDGFACSAATSVSSAERDDPAATAAAAGRAVTAWLDTQPNIASRPDLVAAVVSEAITAVQSCGIRSAAVLPDVAGGIAAAAVVVAPASAAAVYIAAAKALPADEHRPGPEAKIAAAIDGKLAGADPPTLSDTPSAPLAARSTQEVAALVDSLASEPQASPHHHHHHHYHTSVYTHHHHPGTEVPPPP